MTLLRLLHCQVQQSVVLSHSDPAIFADVQTTKPKTSNSRKGTSTMTTSKNQPSAGAMAFYHADGFPSAWKQAAKFAGQGGYIATAPDIVAARLATGPDDYPWSAYFTTTTAEYFGKSKEGKYILIIAHGVGPMATLDGIQRAYSWEYQDKSRARRGGRITEQEFHNLEAGKYGEVTIVDYEAYCGLYEYPLCGVLRTSEALMDPILKARFGSRTEEYVQAHAEHARRWHREQAGLNPNNRYQLPDNDGRHEEMMRLGHQLQGAEGSDPYILDVNGASNCSYGSPRYGYRKIEEGYALAHLVSVNPLRNLGHREGDSLVGKVDLHEWSDSVRLIAMKQECDISKGVRKGPDPERLLRKHWRELLVLMSDKEEVGFRALVQVGDEWFTQYLKKGDGLDNVEPEYHITDFEKVGEPIQFRTTIGGWYGWLKYGINEVKAIAPFNANAYQIVGEVEIEMNGGNATHHICQVQFYRVTVDNTKRLMRADQLRHDYTTLMELMEKEVA